MSIALSRSINFYASDRETSFFVVNEYEVREIHFSRY